MRKIWVWFFKHKGPYPFLKFHQDRYWRSLDGFEWEELRNHDPEELEKILKRRCFSKWVFR